MIQKMTNKKQKAWFWKSRTLQSFVLDPSHQLTNILVLLVIGSILLWCYHFLVCEYMVNMKFGAVPDLLGWRSENEVYVAFQRDSFEQGTLQPLSWPVLTSHKVI